jgi:hypothetical protein
MSGIHFGELHAHPDADARRAGTPPPGPLQRRPAGPKLVALLVLVAGTAVLPVTWLWWHGAVGALLVVAIVVGRGSVTGTG